MGLLFESWLHDVAMLMTLLAGWVAYKTNKSRAHIRWSNLKSPSILAQWRLDMKLITMKTSLADYLDVIYKMFPGEKVVTYSPFFQRVVLVRNPAMVEKVLVKDFGYFHDHGVQVDPEVNPLEGNLFNMTGDKWRALRARLAPVFSSGRLKNMFPQVVGLADKLTRVVPQGEEILIRDYLSRFAIDVIGSTAFGVEAGALENPEAEFRRMALKIFRPTTMQMMKAMMRGLFPKFFKALKIKAFDNEVNDWFFSVSKQALDHRAASGTSRGDFVDLLLQLRGKGKIDVEGDRKPKNESSDDQGEGSELVLTDELLTAQIFIFLVAGWETAVTAMTYTTYLLAKHQDVQDRLREEIRSVEKLDYETVKSMAYLDACISESMRMYPPGQFLLRVCTKDYLFVDESAGCAVGRVKKGTHLLVPVASVQMDPDNFPCPEAFDPTRFYQQSPPNPGTFLPFGNGPRVCIAQRFALMEVRVALAKLVNEFRLALGSKTSDPIVIDTSSFTNDIKGGLWITLRPLEDGSQR